MLLIIRMLILGIMGILWLIAGLAICLCRPGHPWNLYALTQMLRLVQLVVGVRVTYRFDVKELRSRMPAIFVGNHQTNWDIVTVADVPQPGLVCIGKKSLIWVPVFGILFYLSGNILIDRSNRSRNGEEFLSLVRRIRKKNLSLWIFPEGHRSKGSGMLPFKTGAVHTAKLAGVPIIPFVTSSYYGQIKLNRWDNGEIIVEMLPPRDVSGLEKSEIRKFTQNLRQDMIARIKELDKEVRRPDGFVLPDYDSAENGSDDGAKQEPSEQASEKS